MISGGVIMIEANKYQHLSRRYGSAYKGFFVTGTRIRAEVLYDWTVGPDPLTPEEVASDYDLPLEAVLEAIHYCEHHPDVLEEDRLGEEESIRRLGLDKPPRVPHDYKPDAQ